MRFQTAWYSFNARSPKPLKFQGLNSAFSLSKGKGHLATCHAGTYGMSGTAANYNDIYLLESGCHPVAVVILHV